MEVEDISIHTLKQKERNTEMSDVQVVHDIRYIDRLL
jgi:hypothetical protein